MMLHSMLAGLFDNGYDWSKVVGNLPLGLMAAGLGLASVFVILGVLILFVTILHKIMERVAAKKRGQTLPILPPAEYADTQEDARVAAAVTAAITSYYEQEQAETGEEIQFIIRKIKRTR